MSPQDISGYLSKWTNVINGYQKRWFLLQGSLLSYYRNPESLGRRCRGTFDLKSVTLDVNSSQESFKLIEDSGRKHYLKAQNNAEKTKWVKALMEAINAARRHEDVESDSFSEDFLFDSDSQSRSLSENNRRSFFRHRTKNNSPSPLPENNRKQKGFKIPSPSKPVFQVETVNIGAISKPDQINSDVNHVSNSEGLNTKHPPLDADFDFLINRLRRSSVTTEISALRELISSVDIFRTRLSHHSESLCSYLMTIESLFTTSEGKFVASAEGSNVTNLCPSCKQPIGSPDSREAAESLHATLGEHRQYVKEFQDTCLDALQFLLANIERWQRRILSEQERCLGLERTVEQLARQHRALELQLSHFYAPLNESSGETIQDIHEEPPLKFIESEQQKRTKASRSLDSIEDDQFFDACSSFDGHSQLTVTQQSRPVPRHPIAILSSTSSLPSLHHPLGSSSSESSFEEQPTHFSTSDWQISSPERPDDTPLLASTAPSVRVRRQTICPSPKISLNLWSMLKSAIGKDLTKIPLPVNFNEPLSFLQRASEDLTYSDLLDKASQCHDPADQMALIAAFSVSCYASTAVRTGKPFNPLLGETYELDRSDDTYGWRLIAEQVSHHPPGSALYCESVKYGWKLWFEFVLASAFRGKYMSVLPKGSVNLLLPDGSRYTWSKVTTIVHNLIVGSLWIDNCGEVLIRNHTNGYQCPLRFIAHSYFSRGPQKQVTGVVQTASGVPVRMIRGSWESYIESLVLKENGEPASEAIPLWRASPLAPDADKIYYFSQFAVELNEPEPMVAPTDSRLRPDQRLMEEGSWDAANKEKHRLEQKQRAKRHQWEKQRESGVLPLEPLFNPRWFAPMVDSVTGEQYHMYLDNYWEAKARQDWTCCPDIY